MSTQKLFEIYENEHVKYSNEHVNGRTSEIEKRYEILAEAFLKKRFKIVESTGNSFLNHLGADYVVKNDGPMYTVDLKGIGGVCPKGKKSFEMQHVHFAFDTHKKNYGSDGYHHILDDKITDFYLCINKYYYALIPRYIMKIMLDTLETRSLIDDVYFFLERDKNYKTKKAVFDLFDLEKEDFDKIVLEPVSEEDREFLKNEVKNLIK